MGTASTWGRKRLFCCLIAARCGPLPEGEAPFAGSSHNTTPEKSLCRRTAESRESASTTVPLTLAHQTGSSQRPLKKIRQSQVIMVVQSIACIGICAAHLRAFQAEQHIGRQVVKEIRAA